MINFLQFITERELEGTDDYANEFDNHEKQLPSTHKDLYNAHHDYMKNLTHEQNRSLIDYINDSSDLNYDLISSHRVKAPPSKYHNKKINNLDQITTNAPPLEHELNVFSGTGHWDIRNNVNKNDIVHTPAFMSTSISPFISKHFSGQFHADPFTKQPARDGHILHFRLPKGYNKGAYIPASSSDSDFNENSEQEFLLARNQKWKYVGTHRITSNSQRHGDPDANYNMHILEPAE